MSKYKSYKISNKMVLFLYLTQIKCFSLIIQSQTMKSEINRL